MAGAPRAEVEVVSVGITGVGIELAEGEFDGEGEFPAVGRKVKMGDVGATVGGVSTGPAEDEVAVGIEAGGSPIAVEAGAVGRMICPLVMGR